ncbi:MAG: hypothetical protein IPM50_12335 [Acidobacteriota bacterium]|nr:MAG: hypothetical protein IPM50_12335 [Acidobacteriota bacterium]
MTKMPHFVLKSFVPVLAVLIFSIACSNVASKNAVIRPVDGEKQSSGITIIQGSPSETVRAFYTKLREKKYREAIFLTNLRPAVEGLTDAELADLSGDLSAIAGQVPEKIEITGEIITGDSATVTLKLPDPEGNADTDTVRLRRSNGVWIMLAVDEASEEQMRKEGTKFLYNLRITVKEDEARSMLDRIAKAQYAYSTQNSGILGDLRQLVGVGLLPQDVLSSESTGYIYSVTLSESRKGYSADAVPAVYGKTGRLSFRVVPDSTGLARMTSRDNGGKPLEK